MLLVEYRGKILKWNYWTLTFWVRKITVFFQFWMNWTNWLNTGAGFFSYWFCQTSFCCLSEPINAQLFVQHWLQQSMCVLPVFARVSPVCFLFSSPRTFMRQNSVEIMVSFHFILHYLYSKVNTWFSATNDHQTFSCTSLWTEVHLQLLLLIHHW